MSGEVNPQGVTEAFRAIGKVGTEWQRAVEQRMSAFTKALNEEMRRTPDRRQP